MAAWSGSAGGKLCGMCPRQCVHQNDRLEIQYLKYCRVVFLECLMCGGRPKIDPFNNEKGLQIVECQSGVPNFFNVFARLPAPSRHKSKFQ